MTRHEGAVALLERPRRNGTGDGISVCIVLHLTFLRKFASVGQSSIKSEVCEIRWRAGASGSGTSALQPLARPWHPTRCRGFLPLEADMKRTSIAQSLSRRSACQPWGWPSRLRPILAHRRSATATLRRWSARTATTASWAVREPM